MLAAGALTAIGGDDVVQINPCRRAASARNAWAMDPVSPQHLPIDASEHPEHGIARRDGFSLSVQLGFRSAGLLPRDVSAKPVQVLALERHPCPAPIPCARNTAVRAPTRWSACSCVWSGVGVIRGVPAARDGRVVYRLNVIRYRARRSSTCGGQVGVADEDRNEVGLGWHDRKASLPQPARGCRDLLVSLPLGGAGLEMRHAGTGHGGHSRGIDAVNMKPGTSLLRNQ